MNKHRVVTTLLLSLVVAACSSSSRKDDENVGATAQALTRSLTAHPLAFVNGTYSGCVQRPDGSPWSLRIAGAGALPHAALTVVKNDVACHLNVTDLDSNAGDTYTVDGGSYAIADDWSATSRTFASASNPGTDYLYANIRLDDVLFNDAFVLTVRYSDDANDTAVSVSSNYSVVTATAVAERVPAPDYTIDVSSLVINTDANGDVDTTSGAAAFTLVTQTAEDYVVLDADIGGPTWADVDSSWNSASAGGGMNIGVTAFTGSIPSVQLAPHGMALATPHVRTVILRHTLTGVPSYTTFTITFTQ